MTNRIGDRPRFPLSNQRFDKGDAENIARYYEEIISRFTGSIYGQAWGCMSNPQFEVVTGSLAGPYIRPKRCVLLYTVPADGTLNTTDQDLGPWNATIVQFDPARAGQPVQSLYTSTYFPAGRPPLRPWILFRRSEAATNTGNKAYWDTDSNTEEVGAAPLQDSEYVEFRLSTTYSSGDRGAGWYRCAYIDSWGSPASAATPVIKPIHWMDSQYYKDDVPPPISLPVASALVPANIPGAVGAFGFNPLTEMPELSKLLHWMAGKLGQHYSTESTLQVTEANQSTFGLKPGAFVSNLNAEGGWLSTPPRGLVELDTAATAVAAALATFQAQVRRTSRLLHVLYVTPTAPFLGEGAIPPVTFNVSEGSDTTEPTSLAPTIGATGSGASLQYALSSPSIVPGGGGFNVTLQLTCDPAAYSLSSVVVSPYLGSTIGIGDDATVYPINQRYTAALPPAAALTLTFSTYAYNVSLTNVFIRPFAVHIYGRNI